MRKTELKKLASVFDNNELAFEILLFVRDYPDNPQTDMGFGEVCACRRILHNLINMDLAKAKFVKNGAGARTPNWRLNEKNIRAYLIKYDSEKIKKLEKRLNHEVDNQFFICPKFCERYTQEDALYLNYQCSKCESVLVQHENSKTIVKLERDLVILKKSFKKNR